ncbi:hypothetical protein FD724_27035 [Nostoc sp. C057]|uniref:hypothetical protein n=1 Tax=Nostoc sp. C057 TaxID=2576903 RepID=UPI002117806F|nr:hypothetical protein [Nostoc sp. C057]QLE51371.1 hypothetical protein FD724_27035 [Nostoc sp. C057]
MSETINLEKVVLDNLRILSNEKQQQVLYFVEFLVQKTANCKQLDNENSDFSITSTSQPKRLFLREIARRPVAERHKILEPFIAATAEDFLNDPELTEFSVLDREDWETENDNIIHVGEPESTHNHDGFLNGYILKDEGLYDDYANQKENT